MGVTIHGPQFGEDAESEDAESDDQPYGEAFTHEWRLEHAAQGDQLMAAFDEAINEIHSRRDAMTPPRDVIALLHASMNAASAHYAAANVRAKHVPETRTPRPASTIQQEGDCACGNVHTGSPHRGGCDGSPIAVG